MSIVLWPRQEVLQLVISQLGQIGKHLSNSSAIACIKQLSKHQTIEGKISFDHWLIVAKDTLKWNDNCIQLFWEMLCSAVYYLNRDTQLYSDRENFCVDLEFIAIFLVLHTSDSQPSKSAIASSAGYDTAWPNPLLQVENETLPLSPMSSPTKSRKFPNVGSPQSPRSPKQSPKPSSPSNRGGVSPTNGANSSKRSFYSNSRTPRSTAQYLHSVRQKIPVILRALCSDLDGQFDTLQAATPHTPELDGESDKSGSQPSSGLVDFAVARKTIDALGLIVCGGHSRDEHISVLSLLHPHWSAEVEPHLGSSNSMVLNSSGSSYNADSSPFNSETAIAYSELTAWFNLHLSMNDILYPVSLASNYSASGVTANSPGHQQARDAALATASAMELLDGSDANSNLTAKSFQPVRVLTAISSLSRFTPTVINNCSTTVMHVVTSGPSRAPSFRRINSTRSQDISVAQSSENAQLEHNTSFNLSRGGLLNQNCMQDILGEETTTTSATSAGHLRKIDTADHGINVQQQHSPLFDQAHLVQSSGVTRMDFEDCAPSLSRQQSGSIGGDDSDSAKFDLSHDVRFRESFSVPDGEHIPGMWSGSNFASSGTNSMVHPELTLPQLFLSECKRGQLYLVSPYYSASLTGCEDCEVVIGAVFGAVIVNGCERMKITVACRKLIVLNCLECEFHVATLGTTIIGGDSRGLSFGPYNSSYRNLKNHLRLADLQQLAVGTDGPVESPANCWSSLCDVNACLDAVLTSSSPSGYAVDALADRSLLPPPPGTTAIISPPERFYTVSIPFKQEFLAYEYCAIAAPSEYVECLQQTHQEMVFKAKTQIAAAISDAAASNAVSMSTGSGGSTDDERKEARQLASAAISRKFMEWLMASEHAQQVLDLIRIDNEKAGSGGSGNGH